jgi:FixJ family two-component response regulator
MACGSTMGDFLETGDVVVCVLLDALMPGEASAWLALHLKERGIPVVMISGSPEAVKYAEDHGLQLLPKSFRAHELYSGVNMTPPAASSDSDYKVAADAGKRRGSENVQLVRVLPGWSRDRYELS